jgi:hypothetical protein
LLCDVIRDELMLGDQHWSDDAQAGEGRVEGGLKRG